MLNDFRKNSVRLSIALMIISIYFSASVVLVQNRNALASLSDAKIFSQKWDKRHELIVEMIKAGETDIHVELIRNNFMNIEHIQSDPGNPVNICAAGYYGAEYITAE